MRKFVKEPVLWMLLAIAIVAGGLFVIHIDPKRDALRDAVKAIPQRADGVTVEGRTQGIIGYIDVTQITDAQETAIRVMAPILSGAIQDSFAKDPELKVILILWDSPGEKADFVMSFDRFDLGSSDG